jgi:hypothetical protein
VLDHTLSLRVLFGRPEFGYGLLSWAMISRFRGCLVGIFGLSALAHSTSTLARIRERLISQTLFMLIPLPTDLRIGG